MRIVALLLLTFATGWTGAAQVPAASSSQAPAAADLTAARSHLKDGNYPEAETVSNAIVNRLIAITDKDRNQRRELAGAYEVLAMVHYRLSKPQLAETDFTQLLTVDPAYVVGEAVIATKAEKELFAKRKGELVGVLRLEVKPEDARVLVNGTPIESRPIELEVLVGTVSVSASRAGYLPAVDKKYDIVLGPPVQQTPLSLELRRSSTFEIVTAPAGVEVRIDRGQWRATPAGTPPKEFGDALRAQTTADPFSGVLSFPDITTGEHTIEFRKECFTTESVLRTIPPGQHDTFMVAQALRDAKATVKFSGGGSVYVDDVKAKPVRANEVEVCAGNRVVDVRTDRGRSVHRLDGLSAGETRDITPKPRPAIAILDVAGTQTSPGDLRVTVENALLGPGPTVTIFAPPLGTAQTSRQVEGLKPDWLAFDLGKEPIVGSQAAGMSVADRRKSSQALAAALEAQGVASISVPRDDEPRKVLLTLLAADSGVPDVLLIDLNRSDLRLPQPALDLLGSVKVVENSIGVQTMDVRDVAAAVVVRHLWRSDASLPALNKGDRIVYADNIPIKDTAGLREYVQSKQPNDRISLRIDRGGPQPIDVPVGVTEVPRLIGVDDETLLPNKLILDFNDMLKDPALDESRRAATRLNLAVALMRVGNYEAARRELTQLAKAEAFVTLDDNKRDRPGVSNGTVQYLLGLCLKELRQDADAEAIFKLVAEDPRYADALLTQDGPRVQELAQRLRK